MGEIGKDCWDQKREKGQGGVEALRGVGDSVLQ